MSETSSLNLKSKSTAGNILRQYPKKYSTKSKFPTINYNIITILSKREILLLNMNNTVCGIDHDMNCERQREREREQIFRFFN